jgi:hypothetical protein
MAVVALGTLDREGLLSPALALGAFYVWSDNLDEPGGKASFSLVAGTFDACALHVQSSAVDVRVCAAMVVGRFSAVGSHTDAPASDAKLFAAAGASSVLRVQLGGAFELSARLGLGMTLRRSSYEFASTVFHTSARLTTSASLGVGVRLW